MQQAQTGAFGVPPPEDVRERVSTLVREKGIARTAETLGLGRSTVVRIIAGVGLRRGTIAQVRGALSAP